jgi:uncharacterized protein (TIGR02147 family)
MDKNNRKGNTAEGLPDLFVYLDYRKYLRDLCAAKKTVQPHFSYRYLSQKVRIRSAGFFSMVLQGKRNISDRLVLELARFFKLSGSETAYFELMVAFNQASTHEERKHAFEKLLTMRRGAVKQVGADQFEYYRKWYYSALRELVAIMNVTDGNHDEIAKVLTPPVKPAEVKTALRVLSALGMVTRNEKGVYERTDTVISSREHVPMVALHGFQIDAMDLAKAALDRFDKNERELSTVTMGIDDDAYLRVLERLALFRAEVMEIARSVRKPSRVMQLNMQYFPLALLKRKADHE